LNDPDDDDAGFDFDDPEVVARLRVLLQKAADDPRPPVSAEEAFAEVRRCALERRGQN